jgi:AcrR family transcriptional regulator
MAETHPDELKRADILVAAERLFGRQGYEKTSIKEIASGANVALGTIYANFGSKLGVLEAIIQQRIDDMASKLTSLVAADPVTRFVEGVRVVNRSFVNDPFMRNLVAQVPELHEPRLVERGRKIVELFGQAGKAALVDAIQRGKIACDDPDALIAIIRCATFGWLQWEATGENPIDHERLLETLLSLLVRPEAPPRRPRSTKH